MCVNAYSPIIDATDFPVNCKIHTTHTQDKINLKLPHDQQTGFIVYV